MDVSGKVERRLAAILAADVAGYTRLMADDEPATYAAITDYRRRFRSHIERHDGRVVDMAGDSVLAIFSSAIAAVTAATETQKELNDLGADLPEARRMRFRIGINLDDILEAEDGAVYGDGVNIAARLESLANPGGICVSAAIAGQIDGRLDENFVDIGEHPVKNVAKPVHAFAWGAGPTPVSQLHAGGGKPTVAVGKVDAKGGADADLLASGVEESIAAAFSNQTGIVLLSDANDADYVAMLSLQVLGNRYRVTVRVLDRVSGQQFTSDRFDGDSDDPFRTQDTLAQRIHTFLRFAIHGHRASAADSRPDTEQDTETLLARAGMLTTEF